jgi:hypothetical protein
VRCVHKGRGLSLAWMRRKAPGAVANYRYRMRQGGVGGGVVLSLIKLAKVWGGGTYSHSDSLVFTTLWPTAVFLPSSFPFSIVFAILLRSFLPFSYGGDPTSWLLHAKLTDHELTRFTHSVSTILVLFPLT